jgi:hypothetical protein
MESGRDARQQVHAIRTQRRHRPPGRKQLPQEQCHGFDHDPPVSSSRYGSAWSPVDKNRPERGTAGFARSRALSSDSITRASYRYGSNSGDSDRLDPGVSSVNGASGVNPKMLARLTEIEDDLIGRRERAEREAWLGEIEGIDLTLSFLRQKRSETELLARLASAATLPPDSQRICSKEDSSAAYGSPPCSTTLDLERGSPPLHRAFSRRKTREPTPGDRAGQHMLALTEVVAGPGNTHRSPNRRKCDIAIS